MKETKEFEARLVKMNYSHYAIVPKEAVRSLGLRAGSRAKFTIGKIKKGKGGMTE